MSVVIVGGTSGLGLELARYLVGEGLTVVVAGRDEAKARAAAAELGPAATAVTLDLARPQEIAAALAEVGTVTHLVLTAVDRQHTPVTDYDVEEATRLVTLKLVGYSEVVHALLPKIDREYGSILVFGGHNKDRPRPGSLTMTTVNAAVVGMVKALATELAPLRVNGIHPGIVGDSPRWRGRSEELDAIVSVTPTGRYVTTADVVRACAFLLENRSVNGVNLTVDGGRLLL